MLRICNIPKDFFIIFIEILWTINSFGLRCWKNKVRLFCSENCNAIATFCQKMAARPKENL